MKRLYWRPTKIVWQIHALIALVAILSMMSVEYFKVNIKRPYYGEKIKAARIMAEGMNLIRKYRQEKISPIDYEVDPLGSGMIGTLISAITSNTGSLDAKLATVNPNWAAVLVTLLKKAGVEKGDTIAAGFTGSFPALNLATLAAAEALHLKVIAISSLAASTWGANLEKFSWLDMEQLLYDNKIISNRSVAASLGGTKDRAVGMAREGRQLLLDIITRHKVEIINIKDEQANLNKRMEIYLGNEDQAAVKVFVNVGGGTISVGTKIGKQLFQPGLNRRPSPKALSIDSVMSRFARKGIPIIHMTQVRQLAEKFNLPFELKEMPRPGIGGLYASTEYYEPLVVGALLVIVTLLFIFIKRGVGYRIFTVQSPKSQAHPPEPMV